MIPMVDLKRQFTDIRGEIIEVLTEVLESSQYILGSKVKTLETLISQYHGVSEAIGVASGTDALHLSVEALDIGEGDEVITTPFTFFATAEAIIYTGATPVFVDIEPETMNINPALIEKKITEKTRAILPVHIFGHPADMSTILTIAKKHDLLVIEDCAQSFGASINSKKTGSFGEAGCFSFYPSKNLGAFGDAGMVLLNSSDTAEHIRKLRNHGSGGAYRHDSVGFNSRLDEIQAAILLVKMKRLDDYNEKRRRHAALYSSLLEGVVKVPVELPGCYHVYHQYTVRSKRRDELQQILKENGVSSVVYYPIPLHLQKALDFLDYKEGDLPVAEETARHVLSLPMYPELEEDAVRKIAGIIRNA